MATLTVTTLDDETFDGGDLAAETADGGGLSLREAIGLAQDGDVVAFDFSLSGGSVILTGDTLSILQSITINGDINGDDVSDIDIAYSASSGTIFAIAGDGVNFINDHARLDVNSDVFFGGGANAIDVTGNDVTFINRGELFVDTLDAADGTEQSTGILYQGENFTFTNEAGASVISDGRWALEVGLLNSTPATITNFGLLQGDDDALRFGLGTIVNAGVIRATGEHIVAGRAGLISDGISVGVVELDFADIPETGIVNIENQATGLIEGVRSGLNINGGGVVNNDGRIVGNESGILISGYTSIFTGVVAPDVPFSLVNTGEIQAMIR